MINTETYRSGHNGADSKFLEAPTVSSAENVRRTGLCAGSDYNFISFLRVFLAFFRSRDYT